MKTKKSFKVVGIEVETTVQECMSKDNPCPKLWEDFMKRYKEIKNTVGGTMYGLCIATGECSFKYVACMEVRNFSSVPKGMVKHDVPAGKYYVHEHKGTLDKLGEAYGMLTEKFKKEGIKETGIWFELYDERFKLDSDDSIMEIWCAIKT